MELSVEVIKGVWQWAGPRDRELTLHCDASDTIVRCLSFVICLGERVGRLAASPEMKETRTLGHNSRVS